MRSCEHKVFHYLLYKQPNRVKIDSSGKTHTSGATTHYGLSTQVAAHTQIKGGMEEI